MKTQLINTNYIFDHKLFKLWKFPAMFYGLLLIFKTANGLKEMQEYENLISIISNCIIGTGFVLFFLNMFIYSKIGELILENGKLYIKKYNGKETEIDLSELDSLILGNDKGKFYSMTINNIEIEVLFDKKDLSEFTETLSRNGVELKNKYLYERILKLLKVKK